MGSGIGYRDSWKKLSDERRNFFSAMCYKNNYYYKHYMLAKHQNC